MEDNVLDDEDDKVDVVCSGVVGVVDVCGVGVVDICVVFCCVITGDDVSGCLVVTVCDVVSVCVVDWVNAGCNVMAWAVKILQGLRFKLAILFLLRCINKEKIR